MKTAAEKIYTFSCVFIQLFSILLTALLFAGGFLVTCYSLDMESQKVLTRWDNPLTGILGLLAFLGLMFLTVKGFYFLHDRTKFPDPVKFLTVLVLLWVVAAGAVLIVFGKTVPAADAMSVYQAAQEFAAGNTSSIHPTDSYLSYYPHQTGIMVFFELLHRLCRILPTTLPAYHFFKCIYVILTCVIILFQKATIRLLWDDPKAECIYLLLAGANLPFLMYSSFVYGEIPSFALFSAGLYFLLKLFSAESRRRSLTAASAAICFFALSVMLRKNNLILAIAILITAFLYWLKRRKTSFLVFALLCALCCFSILPLVQKGYELRADSQLSSGVPAISYFAMGMQESSRADGWYNGFNFETYRDTGLDTDATVRLSRSAIRERLSYFGQHPLYTLHFYLQKHLSQWADGTYACRQATLATFGSRSAFFNDLYEGKFSRSFISYSNLYQNVLYLGALLFCLYGRRRPRRNYLPEYIGLIGVTGGFLFHIIWEANSRYIFPYSLLLIPYCARGLSLLSGSLNNMMHRGQ